MLSVPSIAFAADEIIKVKYQNITFDVKAPLSNGSVKQ